MPDSPDPADSAQQEDLINLILSLPGSTTCFKDAEEAIERQLSIDPEAAQSLLQSLIQQNRIEARTLPANEAPAVEKEPTTASPCYQWVRTGERNW